jgi:RNA polymerase sigma-70 factor (ECF subfamily)
MTLGPAGIEALYRSHGHLVLRRARHLLGSDDLAQEALQEVFASLLRSPSTVRHEGALVGWLYQATTHFCLNQLRNKRASVRLMAQAAPPSEEAADTSGDAVEALQDVRRVLSRLPEQEASAVVYHHLDGMTHDEVAALLGCSRRQVGYLLERASRSAMEEHAKEQLA